MPVVPEVPIVQQEIGVPRYPRTSVGDSFGSVFKALGEIDQKIQETDTVNELSNATTKYMEGSDQIARDLKTEGVNHQDFFPLYQERHKALLEEINGSFRQSKSAQLFNRSMADNFAHSLIGAKTQAHKLFMADEIAELDTAARVNAKLYAENTGDPERQKEILQNYEKVLGFKQSRGVIDANQRGDLLQKFKERTLENSAATELETNPSGLLKNLKDGAYNRLDATKRMTIVRSANSAIRGEIADQERELRLKREETDLTIQKLIDSGASAQAVENTLKDYTAQGVYGGRERELWENRLRQGMVRDSAPQALNAEKLLSQFNDEYPTMKRVADARTQARSMELAGNLGAAGAGKIKQHLNSVQQSLIREGRVEANQNKPQVTNEQIAKTIGENYPYDKAATPSKDHREDIAKYNAATMGKTLNGEEKAQLAIKIRDDRKKLIQERKARADIVNKLPEGESEALKELNRLKGMK